MSDSGAHFGAEIIDLKTVRFTPELLGRIPAQMVRKYQMLPVAENERCLSIAIEDPTQLHAIDDLHRVAGKEIDIRVAAPEQIRHFVELYYRTKPGGSS